MRARAQKCSPLFLFSKYLLVFSIDIAMTFGWFSLTVNLATQFCCSMSLTACIV
jgi:hypothetical protein